MSKVRFSGPVAWAWLETHGASVALAVGLLVAAWFAIKR